MNLDLIDEAREEAKIKAEAVKRRMERQYCSKVKLRQFQVGDLVMRKAHPYELENKLSPEWTGPFRVTKAKGNGSYKLDTLEGSPIPRSWNAGIGPPSLMRRFRVTVLRRRRARVDDSIGPPSLISRPHIRIVVLRRHHKHPLAFVGKGSGGCTGCSQWDCSDGKR